MTRHFLYSCRLLVILIFTALLVPQPAQAVNGIDITSAQLEPVKDGYRLSVSYSFELNGELHDALVRGIPLSFTTEVELIRPRWYWFDKVVDSRSQTARIAYNVLTRQYRVTIGGTLQQYFDSLEEALNMIRKPASWIVADKDSLKIGTPYQLSLRMYLDVEQLPKPLQVNALNDSDWRLSSERRVFAFMATGK